MAIISFLSIGVVLVLMLTGHLKGQGVGFEAVNEIMDKQQQERSSQKALGLIMKKTQPIQINKVKRQVQSNQLDAEYEKYFEPNSLEFRPLPKKNGLTITETEFMFSYFKLDFCFTI